ncbi:MAG: undecaprenyl/decaprenyl-phosphate alpha-N-acetylglucosaminyl 1-phosphate transferase [Defluviitaleaceae bacterium]|nr:undecaprenyl/decaprenyl-phosphate alpha-N-acetylglucosaminyl 1-phosphate transferase [Defluviitaleaceae bacterium]MCL2836351.1 undecaprenyl/decaprenyl-phosphate alpha-N-acetylglucosaminyl 1-phosphate transferase [Defluviitaleaceae bacterium]
MNNFLAFAISLVSTILLIYPLSKLAAKLQFVDKPTERKKHKFPAPLIGGAAMFLGFLPSFFIFVRLEDRKYISIIIGAFIILAIGLVDDFYKTRKREFPVFPRLIAHISAAALVFWAGIRFWGFTIPFTGNQVDFPLPLQFVITIVWIFGVTTVINWADGLDGLAGGFSGITAVTLFFFAVLMGETSSAFMAVSLIACVAAFLRFNLFPSKLKIFMGDSGANFLGYMLAVISLHGAFKQATVVAIVIPVLALGLPISDSIFVVFKRFIERKPIYKPDHSHFHQRLMKKGLNPVQTVIFLFLICACLNLTSIIIMLL